MNLSLFHFFNGFAALGPTVDMLIVFFAEYLPYLLIIGALLYFWFMPQPRRERVTAIVLSLVAPLISRVIAEMIRFFYHHPRPFVVLHITPLFPETSWSFPSGHASWFFALSAIVYFYNKKAGVLFFVLSTLVCAARVAAGVHWPFDIAAGAVLGVAVAVAVERIMEKLRARWVTSHPSEALPN